ncbi:MAG: dihydroneopterin aldolase [Sulfurospirillum sp.]|nr:MAG: dihydroneopterin aldolase [Sulfurospirillum sp.]
MYTIHIENLKLKAVIGLLDFERTNSQTVIADCMIDYVREDDTFIDYAIVAKMIEEMLKKGEYFLIEDALDEIILAIKDTFFTIRSITLKLSKPEILANCTVSVKKTIIY